MDLSKIVLTHHNLRNEGQRNLKLGGEKPKLPPPTETGSGKVQENEKVLLAKIISKVNDLFEGDITEGVYKSRAFCGCRPLCKKFLPFVGK